jgi:hypothetical protein
MSQVSPRRPRQYRDKRARPIHITERDVEIVALLGRHRYLRSTYIEAFIGGNPTALRWRLRDLFDAGYLQRPIAQWQFADARFVPAVYQLADRGKQLLESRGELALGTDSSRANYLHGLLASEVAASIELGIRRNPALHLITQSEIMDRLQLNSSTSINRLSFPLGGNLFLVPDALFGVRGPSGVVLYALEADRGTEPISRSRRGSSYAGKLEAYRRLIGENLYKRYLNTPAPLVVLHVTPSRTRMQRMAGAAKKMPFHLFRDLPEATLMGQLIRPATSLATEPWWRDGHPEFRIGS